MSEIYVTNEEFVDIHGRKLPVLIKSDGTIYIPLNEIRKTGFHVFPKTDFLKSHVEKSKILDELRFYLLGAAREFLIQKDVNFISKEEINKSIEGCYEKLTENGLPSTLNKPSSGVLGRTLLSNPADLNVSNKILLQAGISPGIGKSSFNSPEGNSNQIGMKKSRMSDPVNSLRMPHQNDISKSIDADFGEPQRKYETLKKRYNKNADQNEQNRNQYNNHVGPDKNNSRKNSESRSNSENEEGNCVKLGNLNLKRIELLPELQEVKVVHIESYNEKLKYWVQLVQNEKNVMNIVEKCMDIADKCAVVQPKLNEIYLAQDNEDLLWYRVIVSRLNPVTKVLFIDFGNQAQVTEVRSIPDDLKSLPAQAVRLVLSKPDGADQIVLEMDQTLTVKKLKQYVDTTYLVQMCDRKRISNPPQAQSVLEPVLLKEINYSTSMLERDIVKIVAFSDGKLYLRNKDLHEKLVEVDIEIRDATKRTVSSVVLGQLVLAKKEGCEEKLSRAVVRKIENNFATVHFIDYHKDEKLAIKNLFGATKKLAGIPATLIEVPLKECSVNKFNSNVKTMLDEFISNNVKFNMIKNGSELNLFHKDKPLTEILFPSSSNVVPVQHEDSKQAVDNDKISFDDMNCFEAPMGLGDYMLTNYNDSTDFTVTSTNDKESDMLTKCTGIDVKDERQYEPEDNEMILAFFEDYWYRACVLECEDNVYQVLFVDYGNIVKLTKKDIRRFPKEFKEIPLLGLMCQLKVKNTEAVKKRLEQLLEVDNIYEINFISFSSESMIYTVDVPKITEILKQEGLI